MIDAIRVAPPQGQAPPMSSINIIILHIVLSKAGNPVPTGHYQGSPAGGSHSLPHLTANTNKGSKTTASLDLNSNPPDLFHLHPRVTLPCRIAGSHGSTQVPANFRWSPNTSAYWHHQREILGGRKKQGRDHWSLQSQQRCSDGQLDSALDPLWIQTHFYLLGSVVILGPACTL